MSQRFEEEHRKIESESVMLRHYYRGELTRQYRRAAIRIAFAIAMLVHGKPLQMIDEIEKTRPRDAECRGSSYLAGTYPMDMKRRIFNRRANCGREAGTLASWI